MTSKKSIFKRVFSCLLAMSFMAAPVFAEETKSDDKALLQVEFLEALGIYDSDKTNMTETEDYLTRENLAVILGGFYGIQPTAPVGANNETGFLDIEPDHWAAERIQAVADRNIMSGYSDGYFRPDNNATYEQAIKTLVVLAGHDISADYKGGWSTGYMNVADELGITDGISLGLNEPIRKGQFTQLLINLLDANMLKPKFLASGEIYYEQVEKTFMNDVLNIYVQKGIMTANEQTSLLGKDVANKGYITVDGVNLKSDDPHSDLLGSNVKAYYRFNEYESQGELLWIEADKRNSVLEIKSEYIIEPNQNGYFTYEEGRNVNKVRIADILSLSVIYNGKLISFASYQDLVAKNGIVKLVDAQGDGIFETALVWNYYDYVVDAVYQQGDKITIVDKRDNIDVLEITLDDNYVLDITNDGNKIEVGAIPAGCVLSVAVDSLSQDKIDTIQDQTVGKIDVKSSFVKMICTRESVVGNLNSIGREGYTIDSQEYRFSPYFVPTSYEVFVGIGLTAYVNNNNEIVHVVLSDGWNYGFVKKVVLLDDEETVLIRLFNSDGEFVEYNVDKLKIDGIVRKGEQIVSDLKTSGLQYQTETNFSATGSVDCNQMIRYFIRNKNIIEIVTVSFNGDEDKTFKSEDQTTSTEVDIGSGNAKAFDDKMYVYTDKTKYFIIPPDMNNTKDFTINSISSSRKNTGGNVINLFDIDDFNIVSLVVEYAEVSVTPLYRDVKNYDMIFEEKIYELNSDGEPTYTLKGILLATGEAFELELESEAVYNEFLNNELQPGDIISWNQNLGGKATVIDRTYSSVSKLLSSKIEGKKQNFTEGYNIIDGTVIRKKDNIMLVNNRVKKYGEGEYKIPYEVLCVFSTSGKVYVYDSTTKTVRNGSLSEIRTEDKYGSDKADKVFIKYQGYTPMRIVIYK